MDHPFNIGFDELQLGVLGGCLHPLLRVLGPRRGQNGYEKSTPKRGCLMRH
jgi:hypothetical protein